MFGLLFGLMVEITTNIPAPEENVTGYVAVYGAAADNMNQVVVLNVKSVDVPNNKQVLEGDFNIALTDTTYLAARSISSGIESDDSNVWPLGKPSALAISTVTVLE